MFSIKADRTRWKEAQKWEYKWEYKGWVSTPQVVENEWKEIVKKYKRYLGELSKRLKIDNTWKILDCGCGEVFYDQKNDNFSDLNKSSMCIFIKTRKL